MIDPVSVCPHVSTIGQRFFPIASKYHFHAAGLIGSPTVPSKRRLLMSCGVIHYMPNAINARIAVAELYKIETLYRSMISQKRSLRGKSGAPSYITMLAPFESGP